MQDIDVRNGYKPLVADLPTRVLVALEHLTAEEQEAVRTARSRPLRATG